MDPQTFPFTPQSELWRLSNTVRNFQEVQQDHAERLVRLERRQEDDARMKSVWGSTSPFPGVLSGTPQQGPLHQSASAEFTSFDEDQSNNMVRSLHLDSEEEPRNRLGANSRANSVRFDASANQGQWSHASRSSIDLMARAPGALPGLGGHSLFERSGSHKSDGRHSSAGHSATSGRANSLGLDTSQVLGQSAVDAPGLAPGLFILGSVPSIIRCWLNTNFKHESLLYAAVCTGSYRSFLDSHLIDQLGFTSRISQDINGDRRIKVPVYLPEAIPQPASSRSSSPAPQVPTLLVDFTVLDSSEERASSKAIQIFLGSDMLRAHNADILFSTNTMTLFDGEHSKLSIPLVRPENEATFKGLYITSGKWPLSKLRIDTAHVRTPEPPLQLKPLHNGTTTTEHGEDVLIQATPQTALETGGQRDTASLEDDVVPTLSNDSGPCVNDAAAGSDHNSKPFSNPPASAKAEPRESSPDHSPAIAGSSRNSSSPAIWSNWRRDGSGSQVSQSDWANASRNGGGTYQRPNRDQGIKVLKPVRQVSKAPPLSASPSTGQSRFFDDGRRRGAPTGPGSSDVSESSQSRRSTSGDNKKENAVPVVSGGKTRTANPIGGASAFGWLNSG